MGRIIAPLTPLAIKKLTKPGLHFVGHVHGLGIHITKSGAKSWILRLTIGSRKRDMGLGSFSTVSLQVARDNAIDYRRQLLQGIDPIDSRHETKQRLKSEQKTKIKFREAAIQYMAMHSPSWKNAKHAAQWVKTLEQYAYPIIGQLSGSQISREHIIEILEPIWMEKTETASRLRGRIEAVLDWMKAKNYRSGDNPAAWKGNLESVFPARSKVSKVVHHAAAAWYDCPDFYAELVTVDGDSARALELCVLTAARSGEARGAKFKEFDLQRKVWTIPAERMKAGKEHRIPITPAVEQLLSEQKLTGPEDFLFTNYRGNPLSDMALSMVLKRMKKDFTAHGFRSTFRDWAGEETQHSREVIEHALAHQLKDKAEAAYARGDLFQKRTKLMLDWSAFVQSKINRIPTRHAV
ncbi:tyrosine-type recombinase/integrase [Mucilaginibacter celer]|uniref:DUF4102 domain-containing protein n=1 Tax=Mucilaginibacter celer TaxID=2305508 RepID=A0A494W6N9_9SPHI|nr:site-specific integrase [Mucilaginibacter celer]AYL99463.1 DUF4102 domain-containing protein [Mucilaginibacter celer]